MKSPETVLKQAEELRWQLPQNLHDRIAESIHGEAARIAHFHERRQRIDNHSSLFSRHRTRTGIIEHQPDGMRAQPHGRQSVLDTGDTADFYACIHVIPPLHAPAAAPAIGAPASPSVFRNPHAADTGLTHRTSALHARGKLLDVRAVSRDGRKFVPLREMPELQAVLSALAA